MANNFYNHGAYPAQGAAGTSAAMRSELDAIMAAFDKLPQLTGNALKAVIVNAGETGLTTTSLTLGTIAQQNANSVAITGGSITGITDLAVADGGTGVSTLTGIVKGNGTSAFSAAAAGTDYQAPIGTISGIAKGNGANALTAATAGTDYAKPDTASSWTAAQTYDTSTLKIKGSSTGVSTFASANAGASNYTVTVPAASFTLAATDTAQTFSGVQTFADSVRGTEAVLASSSGTLGMSPGGVGNPLDLAAANFFTHTFTENTTLANPSNIVAGQEGIIVFTQHASSPKTLAFGTYYKFPGGTVPTITATNSAVDVMAYYVVSSTFIACKFLQDVK